MQSEVYVPEIHKGREVIYACLSSLFLELPSEKMYKMLKTLLPEISVIAEESEDPLLKDGVAGLNKFISKRNALSGEELVAFDDEELRHFTRVYCLTDSVPISESVYTSVEHLAMQKASGQLQALYDACSFDMKNTSNEPPDHVSYELMFMAYLAKGTWKHIENGDMKHAEELISLQRHFISEHMLKWLGDFVKATIRFPESLSLYAPAAYFMLGYIREDKAFLGDEETTKEG